MARKKSYTKKSDKNAGCVPIIAVLIIIVMFRSCVGCDSDEEQQKSIKTTTDNIAPLYNNAIESDSINKNAVTEKKEAKATSTRNSNNAINTSTYKNREPKNNNVSKPAPVKRSSGRQYIRGPRGGCYYINSNGNKTYVDRSLCD
jgi:hypothetical protein